MRWEEEEEEEEEDEEDEDEEERVAAEARHLGRSVWGETHRSRSKRRERGPRRRGVWESTSPRSPWLRTWGWGYEGCNTWAWLWLNRGHCDWSRNNGSRCDRVIDVM